MNTFILNKGETKLLTYNANSEKEAKTYFKNYFGLKNLYGYTVRTR